ncbi:unnamed protein product [Adineta steineri]|uniref:TIR domain-containing protein n=1 Tax=Adineta steineri TaxID=433720 RepID=A0A818XCY3_9BILA|nr:unnamed protein product [Adineta steineri]CAF3737046.1 unnamed protein product [Adineta steineri]
MASSSSPLEQSIELNKCVSGDGEIAVERDINEQINEVESDNAKMLRLGDNTIVPVGTYLLNQSTGVSPVSPLVSSPISSNTPQNEEKSNEKITTTDIRSSLNQHLSEWNRDQVFGWFQSNKLDELYIWLFLENDTRDGANLKEIFDLKRKNYDGYQDKYKNRLPSDNNNLLKELYRFGQLLDIYFIDKYKHRFDVAFSFPGDIRDRVSKIAEKLCEKIDKEKIFYDKYHEVELARPNLDLYLQEIYRYQTKLIVIFMCADYKRKEWCGIEARAIRDLLKTVQSNRIMPLTVDGTIIDGILSIDGRLNISEHSDDYIVDGIYKRVNSLDEALPPSRSSPSLLPQPLQESILLKMILTSKNILNLMSPWYIVVGLLSYILGTWIGR